MMQFAFHSTSPAVSALRTADPQEVGRMLPGTRRRLLPLAGDFRYFQASLRLDYLRLVVVKRPPCASEGFLDRSEIGIALAMSDCSGLTLDGVPIDRPALVSHGLAVSHRIFQPDPLTIGAVLLPEEYGEDRWPERGQGARIDRVGPEAQQRLRSTIREIFAVAANEPAEFSCKGAVAGMRESLLGTIDHAYATAPGETAPGLAVGNYVRICRLADAFIESRAGGQPASSAEIADAAGVTIRTLHNAIVAVRGMSLQKFMILSRLWAVRAALERAEPGELVKTIALDHGFWHLGRFAQSYRMFFNEPPSETMARRSKRKPRA